jgi:hypothetical protein
MRTFLVLTVSVSLIACSQKESGSAGSGSAPVVQAGSAAPAGSATAGSATAAGSGSELATSDDGAGEVAQIVVGDVGSKALGSQKIEASCVSVAVVPAQGDWTVAAARLKDCGDKTARSILWMFKRARNGKWSEDYVGQPPRCWKGVPPDIAQAVTIASRIPSC